MLHRCYTVDKKVQCFIAYFTREISLAARKILFHKSTGKEVFMTFLFLFTEAAKSCNPNHQRLVFLITAQPTPSQPWSFHSLP